MLWHRPEWLGRLHVGGFKDWQKGEESQNVEVDSGHFIQGGGVVLGIWNYQPPM